MGAPKPVLGYPSQRQAILALRQQGIPCRVIARRLDIPILSGISRSRKRGARRSEARNPRVPFPREIIEALRPHGEVRHMHPHVLIRAIVFAVLEDGIIDAVLDDEAPRQPPGRNR